MKGLLTEVWPGSQAISRHWQQEGLLPALGLKGQDEGRVSSEPERAGAMMTCGYLTGPAAVERNGALPESQQSQ